MGCFRALICLLCPPLSVIDRGCGAFLITFVLTGAGYVPGVIVAILFNNKAEEAERYRRYDDDDKDEDDSEKSKFIDWISS